MRTPWPTVVAAAGLAGALLAGAALGVARLGWRETGPVRLLASRPAPAAASVAAGPGPHAPLTVRVLTYNIRHGERDDGEIDLPALARVIRESGADLVALQEVDRLQARSGLVDQARWLARELGMELAYGPALRRGMGQYGNALLSRFPIREWRTVPLPAALEPRGAIVARVATPAGEVTAVATHLGLSRADRRAQATALARALADAPGPLVLLGDWNAAADAPELEPIRERFTPTRPAAAGPAAGADADGTALTLRRRGGAPFAAVDHVFVSPDLVVLDARVLDAAVSDHLPVLVRLALPGLG